MSIYEGYFFSSKMTVAEIVELGNHLLHSKYDTEYIQSRPDFDSSEVRKGAFIHYRKMICDVMTLGSLDYLDNKSRATIFSVWKATALFICASLTQEPAGVRARVRKQTLVTVDYNKSKEPNTVNDFRSSSSVEISKDVLKSGRARPVLIKTVVAAAIKEEPILSGVIVKDSIYQIS